MDALSHPPNITVRSVVTLISTPSVLPKVNSAMHVVGIITSLHSASREVNDRPSRPCKEAISLQDTVIAVIAELHVVPATLHAGTAAIVLTIIALPGPHPTALHIVLPIVHCPCALLDQIGTPHPIGTTRML